MLPARISTRSTLTTYITPQWYPTHIISRHNYQPGTTTATATHGGHRHGDTGMQPGYSGSAGATSGATSGATYTT